MTTETETLAEILQGSVERVTFHHPETGYCVLRLKAQNHPYLVTLVGHAPSIQSGEFVEATGTWNEHRTFGRQFKAETLKMVAPSTLDGIEKYLASGMIKGVGPHYAKKMVEAFGEKVFEIVENEPEKLRTIPGFGAGRIQQLSESWTEKKTVRDLMVFLQSHGVSTSKSVRIFKAYGEKAIQKIRDNPYQLVKDIEGIGFKNADLIAQQLGISKSSLIRARAGIQYVLQEKVGQGHCAYPEEELTTTTADLLTIDRARLNEALELEIAEQLLNRDEIEGTACIYPAQLDEFEKSVAEDLVALAQSQSSPQLSPQLSGPKVDLEKAMEWVESDLDLKLAPLQKEAITKVLKHQLTVITGGPGTGKTTLLRALVQLLKKQAAPTETVRIGLCSPTGRAAKRLSECTGMEAKTIHRLLAFDPQSGTFHHNEDYTLPVDLLLLDECSMVDLPLMYHLLKALPKTASLVLIGDVDQIPSVGPGELLKAIIDSEVIPTIRLTQVFRQAAESLIIQAAHQINHGNLPALETPKGGDFFFLACEEPEAMIAKILELTRNRIPAAFGFNSTRDIQILCPMNRGKLGVAALNNHLQVVLNPQFSVPSAAVMEKFGVRFFVGDKVMVTINDYDKEVFNGDIGWISSIDSEKREVQLVFEEAQLGGALESPSERKVIYDFNEMDRVSLAYSISIHKSQGSEYPVVIIPLSLHHQIMLKRNLIYTAITRGKKLVILVGQKRALELAIKARNQGNRWNQLRDRLKLLAGEKPKLPLGLCSEPDGPN